MFLSRKKSCYTTSACGSGVDVGMVYSQLLAEASDLGLGVCQLDAEVLPALGAAHAGRIARGLGAGRRRRSRARAAVTLLGQLYDRLWEEIRSRCDLNTTWNIAGKGRFISSMALSCNTN